MPDPEGDVEQRVVDAAVAALSPRRRTLLQALFVNEPRPYVDIAWTMGVPVGSLGPTRARALTELRRMLEGPRPV